VKLGTRAVLTGASVDLGTSAFVCGVVSIAFAAILGARGSTTQQIYAALYSWSFVAVLISIGVLLNALGGFIAAAIAGRDHLLYGALSALPCLFLGLFTMLSPLPYYYPIELVAFGWLACIPFGALGGYIASRAHAKGDLSRTPPPEPLASEAIPMSRKLFWVSPVRAALVAAYVGFVFSYPLVGVLWVFNQYSTHRGTLDYSAALVGFPLVFSLCAALFAIVGALAYNAAAKLGLCITVKIEPK
jgi:hypothetical protein